MDPGLLLEPAIQREGHCTSLRNREEKRIEDVFQVWKMSSEDSGSVLHKSWGWRRSEADVPCTIIPVLRKRIKGKDTGKELWVLMNWFEGHMRICMTQ